MSTPNTLEQKFATLDSEVQAFHKIFRSRHGGNFRRNNVFVGLAIVTGAGVAIAGICNAPWWAAFLGVISSALYAMHSAFAIGEKAEFQRIVAVEAEILLSDIRCSDQTAEILAEFRARVATLKRHADTALPRGGGMDAVRRMYDELRKQNPE